ncbi:MAG: hypothetical protein M1823_000490 [Watsoniomyces obsoletus]|nr:MAG: hypothetical protein M1823_000490 [Watsoniomyces obsoletus]
MASDNPLRSSATEPGQATAADITKEYTYADISTHASRKDLYVVVHDKVYDVSGFVDEHPGGEEVMMDVAGQDATEAFEDVGHSDEAREILRGLMIGELKRVERDPAPKISPPKGSQSTSSTARVGDDNAGGGGIMSGFGFGIYALMMVGGLVAYGAWKYLSLGGNNKEGANSI